MTWAYCYVLKNSSLHKLLFSLITQTHFYAAMLSQAFLLYYREYVWKNWMQHGDNCNAIINFWISFLGVIILTISATSSIWELAFLGVMEKTSHALNLWNYIAPLSLCSLVCLLGRLGLLWWAWAGGQVLWRRIQACKPCTDCLTCPSLT